MAQRAISQLVVNMLVSGLFLHTVLLLWEGGSGSSGHAGRSFLLLSETPSQATPSHSNPTAQTHESLQMGSAPDEGLGSSGFCGWAVRLSVTGMIFTFASRKSRGHMRSAWRSAMNAVARLRRGDVEPSSPSSYARVLMTPPTMDFLRRAVEEAEDLEDELPRSADIRRIEKTRSVPAKMFRAGSPRDCDEERPSFSTRQVSKGRAPTLLQQRQVQPGKGWTEPSPKSFLEDEQLFQIPSVQSLQRTFIVQAAESDSAQDAVLCAIRELNELNLKTGRCKVILQESDAKQIYNMLSNHGTEEVSAMSFAVEMEQLLSALAACDQLSLPQLRSIMATAFDRFDFNEDGVLSIDEFSCALRSFNIVLAPAETEALLRFLAPAPAARRNEMPPVLEKEDLTKADSPDLTLEDKFFAAIDGVKEKLQASTGWNNAVNLAEKVVQCLQQPGSPRRKGKRLVDLGYEELASATEISLTLAGVAVVVLNHSQWHPDAAFLEQAADSVDDLVGAVQDLFQAMPMGPALLSGVFTLAKAHKESVALDVDEALLYARYFLPKGCSQSLFHKLLTMAGCHWGTISAGQPLDDHELRILVRGEAIRKHGDDQEDILPGAFLTAGCDGQVIALEDLTYLALNTEKLNACAESVKDAELKDLAQKMLEDSACLYHEPAGAASSSDWFAPVGQALESQAKCRGLVTSSLCPEGLCRILSKPNMSLREKLDQVQTWILSSKDEICDSLEAVADLAGLGSLLAALSTHSVTLSGDNFSQLAPLLILVADVISKQQMSSRDWEDVSEG